MIDEKELQQSEKSVAETDYASMLLDTKNQYEAKMRENEAQHAKTVADLTAMVINGQPVATSEPVEEPRPLEELSKDLSKAVEKGITMDIFEKALALRDAVLKETGEDISLPHGVGPNGPVQPEYGQAEAMNEQWDIVRQLLEVANGDPAVFLTELNKIYR